MIICFCIVEMLNKAISGSERPITDSTDSNRTESGIGSDRFGSVDFADSTESTEPTDSYRFYRFLPIFTDSYRYLPILADSVE